MLPLTKMKPPSSSNECALLVSRFLLVEAEMQWVAALWSEHCGCGVVFGEPKQTCFSTVQAPPSHLLPPYRPQSSTTNPRFTMQRGFVLEFQ